jgi:hypothetical protein
MNLILQGTNSIFEELNMKKINLELIGRPASVIMFLTDFSFPDLVFFFFLNFEGENHLILNISCILGSKLTK